MQSAGKCNRLWKPTRHSHFAEKIQNLLLCALIKLENPTGAVYINICNALMQNFVIKEKPFTIHSLINIW